MRLYMLCLSALPLFVAPQAALAQTAPVDSLAAFLEGGARSWDVAAEPDMVAIARREAVARKRDDALFDEAAAAAVMAAARKTPVQASEPRILASASVEQASVEQASVEQASVEQASVGQASVRQATPLVAAPRPQRTRSVAPARVGAEPRAKRNFIVPWQTGVFQ